MKLIKASNVCLKAMVKAYHKDNRQKFDFSFFQEKLKQVDDGLITDALLYLDDLGYANVLPADCVAFKTTLLRAGIAAVEKDTIIHRAVRLAREVIPLLRS